MMTHLRIFRQAGVSKLEQGEDAHSECLDQEQEQQFHFDSSWHPAL